MTNVSNKDLDRAFDNYLSSQKPWFSLSRKIWNPPADVYEADDKIMIKLEVAGLVVDQIDITLEDRMLIIRGVREQDPDLDDVAVHLLEVNYGRFERVFKLPDKIAIGKIDAHYTNGFLTVRVEKAKDGPRTVTIKLSQE